MEQQGVKQMRRAEKGSGARVKRERWCRNTFAISRAACSWKVEMDGRGKDVALVTPSKTTVTRLKFMCFRFTRFWQADV